MIESRIVDIKRAAKENSFFRKVLVTTGDEPFKLFTIYAPPQQADETVHQTKAEAEAAESHVSA